VRKKGLTLICVLALASIITYSVLGTTTDDLNKQKNDISNQIDDATNQIDEIKGTMTDVNEEIADLNAQILQYQQDISNLNVQLAQVATDISATQTQLNAAQAKYDKQKALLEQRVVAMYEGGDTLYLDVLLASKGIEDFISKYYYLSQMTQYDKDLLDSVQTEKQDFENQQIKLQNQQAQLKALYDSEQKTAATLEDTRTIRNSYLNQLSEKQKKVQSDIDQYEKDLANIDAQILQVSISSVNPNYAGGEMAWPVPGYHTITSGFGMRIHPIFKVWSMHTGVDIAAPEGTPIVAANDGVVAEKGYNQSYGNYILIDHGGGYSTFYGHGSKAAYKSVGDIVKKGDVIMPIGTTGYSTGPHLHFEVRINGTAVDPLPYITSNGQSSAGM